MGHEAYAQCFVGITVTLDEIQKAYAKYIEHHSEEAKNDINSDNYFLGRTTDDYFLENSMYHHFVRDIVAKHTLDYQEINYQSEDEIDKIEVCVYVWKQQTEWMWGHNRWGRINKCCDFEDIQTCIDSKRDGLKSFMDEFGLDGDSHKLKMYSLIVQG